MGGVGDVDAVGGAICCVDLVISSAIVSDEADSRFSQSFNDFSLYSSSDGHAAEGSVDGFCAIKRAGSAFLEKICRIGRLGCDEVGERGECIEFCAGFVVFNFSE